MTEFNGTDMSKAFDAGADAQLFKLIDEIPRLMRFDDGYEVEKFFYYYLDELEIKSDVVKKYLDELGKKLNWR